MGIFSGIEILFFILGVLATLSAIGLIRARKTYAVKWPVLALAALGAVLIVFTLGWCASSILEGEPQAAVMGVLCFGLPVLVIVGLIRVWLKKNAPARSAPNTEALRPLSKHAHR